MKFDFRLPITALIWVVGMFTGGFLAHLNLGGALVAIGVSATLVFLIGSKSGLWSK